MDIKTILKSIWYLSLDYIFSCRNCPDYTFRFRNDSYFKCKLCVKPQQPSFFRDLYLYRKRIADTRTVLVNPRTKSRQDQISILLQIPFSFIFSTFIDFNMSLAEDLHPSNYITSIALLLLGCLIQSIGVVLEIKPQVAMMSAEGFVNYAARRYNKEFGKFKVIFDFTLVTVAIILSLIFTQRIEGVREGSLIAACITGYIVSFLNNKIMTRKMLSRISSILSNLAFNTNINCIHSLRPRSSSKVTMSVSEISVSVLLLT